MKIHFLLAFILACFCAKAENEYYIKEVVFPADADSAAKVEMASRLVPSSKQLAWQDFELTAFIHFGINTFTDREWGNGSEDPALFNPVGLDAEQWVKTLKDASFKMVILTAKHHDGFCLWPTATTSHSVASSPWLDGKGDVMRMLSDACRKHGMKLGVYLSPWDRNAPCYGDSPAYNDMFVAQLTELLTNYGKIDEVWFDGACGEGPNGKKQEYDLERYKATIASLQPEAVTAIMGDDVRWVGNEKGLGRETEWSATALTPGIVPDAQATNQRLGLFPKAPDLGGRDIVAKADKLYWWPSEVDVSIRPGWFWHESESPKSLRQLADIYINSVGRNSVLLLNIPPDTNGRIAREDSIRLAEFGRWINQNFSTPADFSAPVNCVVLKEDISKGQRVERFTVSALTGEEWQPVAEGTTIGHKRILLFDPIKADSMRIDILESRGQAHLLPLTAYNIALPEEKTETAIATLDKSGWKIIDAESSLTVDLGTPADMAGFVYNPDAQSGLITHYQFFTSDNGSDWMLIPTNGEFSNIVNNPIPQYVRFGTPRRARFIRLVPVETVGSPRLSASTIALF